MSQVHPALETRPVRTLLRAAERGALPQGLLLHGRDLPGLELSALAIAERLLRKEGYTPRTEQHADLHWLRPSGKQRTIRIGDSASEGNSVRHLIHNIGQSPSVGARKVAIIVEADCFNPAASNAFLKTLEEPPADTTILLLSTRPHAILPTIRSRTLHFFIGTPAGAPPQAVADWCEAYKRWLSSLDAGLAGKAAAADPILAAYGLVARATSAISALAEEHMKAHPVPESLSQEERDAVERGLEISFRRGFLEAIARTTRDFTAERLLTPGREDVRRKLVDSMARLERVSRLLRYNLSDGAALENYLLSLLRVWVKTS